MTDRVIAMSFPSSGSEALYRNSIRDVGEFLDKKHFGHYRVYNLCCECVRAYLTCVHAYVCMCVCIYMCACMCTCVCALLVDSESVWKFKF